MRDIGQTRLHELLDYDPSTGTFRWRCRAGPRAQVGSVAGSYAGAYRLITIDSRHYKAHRLAWLYVYGSWPNGQIDHINGVKDDNRIANLRDATGSMNNQNRRTALRNNKVGILGVYKDRDRFRADIKINRKTLNLGRFDTAEEAHAAYVAAKRTLHPAGML